MDAAFAEVVVIQPSARPKLASQVRLRVEPGRTTLLYGELGGREHAPSEASSARGLVLSGTGADIARLCTGDRSVEDIARELSRRYARPAGLLRREVSIFLERLSLRGLVGWRA